MKHFRSRFNDMIVQNIIMVLNLCRAVLSTHGAQTATLLSQLAWVQFAPARVPTAAAFVGLLYCSLSKVVYCLVYSIACLIYRSTRSDIFFGGPRSRLAVP